MSKQNLENLSAGTPVWIYLRHSPGDNQSIDSQKLAIEKIAREQRLVIKRVFIDQSASGSSTNGRKDFEYMIHLSRQKPRDADAIIIWEFSRFARNQTDSQFYRAELRRNGWNLVSVKDDIPDGPMGQIFEALTDWKNEQFLIDLKANTRRGLQYIAEQGCVPNGPIAIGYKIEKKQIGIRADGGIRWGRRPVRDPDIAPLIEQAFELKAAGATNAVISEKTGLFGTKSGSWHSFFRNRVYIGELNFGGKIFDSVYPAIISKILFDVVQKQIPDKKKKLSKKYHPRRKGSSFFLANVAICGYCNAPIEGKRVGKYRYYICAEHNTKAELCPQSKVIPAGALEKEIINILLEHILKPQYMQELLEWTNKQLATGLDTLVAQAEKLRKQLSDAETLAIKYAQNFGSMESPTRAAEQLLREQDMLVDQLREQLQSVESEIECSRITTTMPEIMKYISERNELLKKGEYFDLRHVSETLLSRIILLGDEITVELAFPEI